MVKNLKFPLLFVLHQGGARNWIDRMLEEWHIIIERDNKYCIVDYEKSLK